MFPPMKGDRPNGIGDWWRSAGLCCRVIAVGCLVAMAASGCSAVPCGAHSRPASTSATIDAPGQRCGGPQANGKIVTFAAAVGVRLDAAEIGSGAAGVVLVHEYPADLCGSGHTRSI